MSYYSCETWNKSRWLMTDTWLLYLISAIRLQHKHNIKMYISLALTERRCDVHTQTWINYDHVIIALVFTQQRNVWKALKRGGVHMGSGVERYLCVLERDVVHATPAAIWIIHEANQWLKVRWVSHLTSEERWLCVIQSFGDNMDGNVNSWWRHSRGERK